MLENQMYLQKNHQIGEWEFRLSSVICHELMLCTCTEKIADFMISVCCSIVYNVNVVYGN